MKQILTTNSKQLQANKRRKYNGSQSLTKLNLLKFCFLRLRVAPTMLGVVGSVLEWCANGCNNPKHCWDLQSIVGRIQPTRLCKPCVMSVRGRNIVGRAVQTDPTLLRYASAITEQKKCRELSAEKFERFQTLRNNMQQGVQTNSTCNIQQGWEFLVNNVTSVCTQPNSFVTNFRINSCGIYFSFFPDKHIKGAWDYKMRNVRKKLAQLLIVATLVTLAIIWIIHSDFLAPVDRLPDNHSLESRRLSLEGTRVPSQYPHSKPRNLSQGQQYKQIESFAGKICANTIFTRESGLASIILKGQI